MKLILWGAEESWLANSFWSRRFALKPTLSVVTFYSFVFLYLHIWERITAVQIASRREKPTKTWQTFALVGACLDLSKRLRTRLTLTSESPKMNFCSLRIHPQQMIILSTAQKQNNTSRDFAFLLIFMIGFSFLVLCASSYLRIWSVHNSKKEPFFAR